MRFVLEWRALRSDAVIAEDSGAKNIGGDHVRGCRAPRGLRLRRRRRVRWRRRNRRCFRERLLARWIRNFLARRRKEIWKGSRASIACAGRGGFRAAAELVLERAKAYGLTDAQILEFPADGKTFYGTQKSRMAWDAEFAELWEMRKEGGDWIPAMKLADWSAMPITLAEDSESGDVTAELVDVGDGTRESDYAGKEVKGKLVLVAAQPGGVQHLAVEVHGAAGIVSYAQNQRSAWWGEDENLVRWGHLESFHSEKENTFGFMVSLKVARGLRERLAHGEAIHMHAMVKAGQHPGILSVVTATIPGADPKLRDEEIAFSCHLDHQRPGANDNASGCVTILEVARTLAEINCGGYAAASCANVCDLSGRRKSKGRRRC